MVMSGETDEASTKIVPPAVVVKLPTPSQPMPDSGWKRSWLVRGALLVVLLLAVIGAGYWWLHPRAGLPPGIASGNGRLDADEIDIDTKFAGRIVKLLADEGDLTKAGQVLAQMDTQDLEASLKQSQALMRQAQQTINAAQSTLTQQKSQVLLAQEQIARTQTLVTEGNATKQLLDQQQQVLASALAGQSAAEDVIRQSQAALEAVTHATDVFKADIADDALVSPRDGRIEYRVANVGEVLPAGGKIFTILDTSYFYMDIYLTTLSAGQLKVGSDARIVVDSYPTHPFRASVVFIAAQAQFTPKTVETQSERDVLMFRVRVRVDPAELLANPPAIRSGSPGMAYVLTVPDTVWPVELQGTAPK
jgi:HlyD family secretion protein